jgi:hypothetical protein
MAKRGENARIAAEFLKRSEAAKRGAETRRKNLIAEAKMRAGAKRSAAAKKGHVTRREREARGEPPKPRKKPERLENKNYLSIQKQLETAGVGKTTAIRKVNELARIAKTKNRKERGTKVAQWYDSLEEEFEDLDLFEDFDWYI